MELDHLKVPPDGSIRHQDIIRQPILNAGRSGALGFWLVITPLFFLAFVVMKFCFRWDLGLLATIDSMLVKVDKDPVAFWLQPLFLIVAPAAAFVINLLSILHFHYDKQRNELNVNLKLKWWNIVLAIVGIGIVKIFCLYIILESVHHAQ
jgi:hypothetical protein